MKEKDFIKNPISPSVHKEEETPPSKQGPTFGESMTKEHPKTTNPEKKNVINFSLEYKPDGEIVATVENYKNSMCESEEYRFFLTPNVGIGNCDDRDESGKYLVDEKEPLPGIEMALRRMTGKDINIK